MKSLAHQFLDFCRSKPADEEYEYTDNNGCAFAQFLIAAGYSNKPDVAFDSWTDIDGRERPMQPLIEKAVVKCDGGLPNWGRTFGALATRLEQALNA
jgi:hypothetical protein